MRTVDGYQKWLSESFGEEDARKILATYPASADAEAMASALQLFTDFLFVEPTIEVSRAVASKSPVYLYRFTRVNAIGRATNMGAHHAAEVVYVFGTYNAPLFPVPGQGFDETDFALGKAMMGAWVQFAKFGQQLSVPPIWRCSIDDSAARQLPY